MKKIFIVVGVIIVIMSIAFGVWAWRYYTAPIVGTVEKQETVQSGDFRIFSYNHFFDLLVEINGIEADWDAQYDKLQLLGEGTDIYNRTLSNLAAIKSQIEERKKQYNADVLKEETIGLFRDNNLPHEVDTSPHEYGHRTEIKYGG